jgi:hypothetical protein
VLSAAPLFLGHAASAGTGNGRLGGTQVQPAARSLLYLILRGIDVKLNVANTIPGSPTARAAYGIAEIAPGRFERTLNIKPDVTWYEFLHEFMHSIQNLAYGDAVYFRDIKSRGGIEYYEQANFNLLRRYYWSYFSSEERADAATYLAREYGGTPW